MDKRTWKVKKADTIEALPLLEPMRETTNEVISFANGTTYQELARTVLPWEEEGMHGIYLFLQSEHGHGIQAVELARTALEWLNHANTWGDYDVLSVSAGMSEGKLRLTCLVRVHVDNDDDIGSLKRRAPSFTDMVDFLQKKFHENERKELAKLVQEPVVKKSGLTNKEKVEKISHQKEIYQTATDEVPFLNALDTYVCEKEDEPVRIYDLLQKEKRIKTTIPYEQFHEIFLECLRYVTQNEQAEYASVLHGMLETKTFLDNIEWQYVQRQYVEKGLLSVEDVPVLMEKLEQALFQYYVLQDIINDPDVTDINIVNPWSIRVRIKGKTYSSNVTFVDFEDYSRFIFGLAIRNGIDLSLPAQRFTDSRDPNYNIRFSLFSDYASSTGVPILHIRKVTKKTKSLNELIRDGMLDEKQWDFIKDRARTKEKPGILIFGPAGCGKTTLLRLLVEMGYEDSASILVIQESDEIIVDRDGVMITHTIDNPIPGQKAFGMEDACKHGLVCGATVFIIGEVKGGEMRYVLSAGKTGQRTAATMHGDSVEDITAQISELAQRGGLTDIEAKRMMTCFKTIIYMSDYKIKEIKEIVRFDEETREIVFRTLYRRPKTD